MDSPVPILFIIVAYLYFVLKAGPEFMKFRNPIKIDRIVMIYNIIQVLFSLYIVKETFRLLWLHGDYRFNCIEIDYSDTAIAKEKVSVAWLYFFSKVLDLTDTIFFVLRKKQSQVTFLHVYHHTMVVTASWSILRFYPGGQVALVGTINTFVHVIMYSYYFLAIMNPEYKKAWWKKYLTQLQLIQFVVIGVHGIFAIFASDCTFPKHIILITVLQDVLMFILFWNFYQKAYKQSKNKVT